MPGKEIVQIFKHLPFKNTNLYKKIFHKTVNHTYLVSRLQCKDLRNCSCVSYVCNLSEKDLDYELGPWIKVLAETNDDWCPMGPPDGFEVVSQEIDEFYRIPELPESLYYYHTEPIENPVDKNKLIPQEKEEKTLAEIMVKRELDYYYTNQFEKDLVA